MKDCLDKVTIYQIDQEFYIKSHLLLERGLVLLYLLPRELVELRVDIDHPVFQLDLITTVQGVVDLLPPDQNGSQLRICHLFRKYASTCGKLNEKLSTARTRRKRSNSALKPAEHYELTWAQAPGCNSHVVFIDGLGTSRVFRKQVRYTVPGENESNAEVLPLRYLYR